MYSLPRRREVSFVRRTPLSPLRWFDHGGSERLVVRLSSRTTISSPAMVCAATLLCNAAFR